jgi:UDP-N-acetyl-2-amino-2-deoxyglucuronate dehydrogenase
MDKIGVGVIGCGLIAPMHIAGFQSLPDLCEVKAVCDVNKGLAEEQASFLEAKVYTDYRELIADPQIQMIDVLLPHHLHSQVALAVLDAKKALYLEKPVAPTYKESLAICDKARQAGVHFTIAENTRFISAYLQAEKYMKEGKLTDVTLVRTFLPANERIRLSDPEFWGKQRSKGGGCLIDSGPHSFYLLKWLFGDIKELVAFSSTIYKTGSEVEDNAEVRGTLANGAEFQVTFSFTTEVPHSERLEIYGTKGSLILDQLTDPVGKYYADPTDIDGTPVPDIPYDALGWHFTSIVAGVADFVTSYVEHRKPLVDPMDCCYTIKVIEKAYESIAKGNRQVVVD